MKNLIGQIIEKYRKSRPDYIEWKKFNETIARIQLDKSSSWIHHDTLEHPIKRNDDYNPITGRHCN